MKYIINGKIFFKEYVTGLQRYVLEILKELDKLIEKSDIKIELVIPESARNVGEYRNIKIIKYKNGNSMIWEQIHLYKYAKKNKGILLNMANTAPIFKPDILFIHDLNCVINRKYFKFFKYVYYKIMFQIIIKKAKKIITVSEFSRDEISRKYKIKKDKIEIIRLGWQHLQNADKVVKKEEYFFTLGTIDKHKNLKWVIEVAKRNPQNKFLISGIKSSEKVFQELGIESSGNVTYLGYVKDEEMVSLIKRAKALIFPSFYEGFGIPPMEALALGTKAIISDIPVLREIYEDTVYYINPNIYDVDLDNLLTKKVQSPTELLEKYSWKKSANKLFEILEINE